MNRRLDWPALHGFEPHPLFDAIVFERAVWGKVHGAATDFRWIARTPAFAAGRSDIQTQLNLGGEDTPAAFQAWRSDDDRFYAVTGYPSRAIDASGRRGFLEKQVLEWRRSDDVPAVVGALLLLPHAARMTDAVWWDRAAGELWSSPEACLPIDDSTPLLAGEDDLVAAIERGRTVLRESVSRDAIEQLYEQLLQRRSPAFLGTITQPLPPEALAALLLPLPREIADRLSIAGWIPSSRPAMSDLATHWDVLVTPRPGDGFKSAEARQMVEMLLDETTAAPPAPPRAVLGMPQRPRPRMRLDVTPPEPGAPRVMHELYDLAATVDRRWLSPDMLHGLTTFRPDQATSRLLRDWVEQVRAHQPPHADAEQWTAKVDLLRSAAIVLVPDASTVAAVGLPGSHVPALLFGLTLDNRARNDLQRLGDKALHEVLAQSLACRPGRWATRVRQWLERWRRDNGGNQLGTLLGDALSLHS